MPRTARIYIKEGIFHILARGNNRQTIFHDDEDYETYLSMLKKYKKEHIFKLYHYCLMSNHVHLILEPSDKTDLSKLMKQINLSYLSYYRKKYDYHGHFWQDRFKSLLISKDGYLINCGRYIELNPVKAKKVKDPKNYKYSSYQFYAYGRNDGLVDLNPIYNTYGNTESERQYNYRKDIANEVESLNIDLNLKFLGSTLFVKKMEERFKTSNTNQKRGRPRKSLAPKH